jgi:hypothetical protein
MVSEIIVLGFIVWIIFGDYFDARAAMLREQARSKELDNDAREFHNDRNDEEGS